MLVLGFLVILGCSQQTTQPGGASSATERAGNTTGQAANEDNVKPQMPDPASIEFKDSVETNTKPPDNIGQLVFTDTNGAKIALNSFVGKKNVVLVFTKGFNGMLCPFCKTQTSRLVANYSKFENLQTEVLVVYPGPRDHVDEFMQAALTIEKAQVDAVPFPIVLDEDFVATNFFNIRDKHAIPSTYVIDKQGAVQLAYVGANTTADRPSVKAILEKIENVNSAN